MSIILKTGAEISRSPLNNSKAHQMYSFSKAERFPKIKKSGHADTFYNLPEVRSKRMTSIGFGKKSDFTLGDKNNKSFYHQTKRDFDEGNKQGKYYTFGQPREKYNKVYVEGHKNIDLQVPGPGKYFLPRPFGFDAPKFTMKGKYDDAKTKVKNYQKNVEEEKEKDNKYNQIKNTLKIPLEMNPKGKYPVSTLRNINFVQFEKDKSKRFNYTYNQFPGPGKYESKQLLGKIYDSKYQTFDGFTMYGKYKVKDSRQNYPGPGSYKLPSDFGIYVSKNAPAKAEDDANVYPEKKYPFEEKAWRHNMKKIPPEELKKRKELYLGEYYLDDFEEEEEERKRQEEEEERKRREEEEENVIIDEEIDEEEKKKEEEERTQREKEEEEERLKKEEEERIQKEKEEEEERLKKEEEERIQKEKEEEEERMIVLHKIYINILINLTMKK